MSFPITQMPPAAAAHTSTATPPRFLARTRPGARDAELFIHDKGQWRRCNAAAIEYASRDGVFRVSVDSAGPAAITSSPSMPLFTAEAQGVRFVSDCPSTVAAASGLDQLDHDALLLHFMFGFLPDDRTMFVGVRRCTANAPAPAAHPDPGQRVRDIIVDACARGHWLELTGGLDSQLVLALAVDSGARPDTAMTIGAAASSDAVEAARVCAALGLHHRRVEPAPLDRESVLAQSERLVFDGRFLVNPVEIAHIYATLETIDDERAGQISGVGGEAVGGFYTLGPRNLLGRASPSLAVGYAAKYSPHTKEIFGPSRTRAALAEFRRSWTDEAMSGDAFYRRRRIVNWAAPVLLSSSCRYDAVSPLMTREYLDWIEQFPGKGRQKQVAAMRTLARSTPSLECLTPLRTGAPRNGMMTTAKRVAASLGVASRHTSAEWNANADALSGDLSPGIIEWFTRGNRDSRFQFEGRATDASARLIGLLWLYQRASRQAERTRRDLQHLSAEEGSQHA